MISLLVQTINPYQLDIGEKGQVSVKTGQIIETKTSKPTSAKGIARQAKGYRYILLGESHDHADHHWLQAEIIHELAKSGRDVVVGLEMFTRPVQSELFAWSLGWQSEGEFIEKSKWKTEWGFDFGLYRPIFEAAKKFKLPLVALNVPRDWVRKVGREGLAALTEEQRQELPKDIDLGNQNHRSIFSALMGGHPVAGTRGENIYSAQVLWDAGMADTATKWMEKRPKDSIMVIVAGSGHVMYKQGINWRITQTTGEKTLDVVMIEGDQPQNVSKGISDYVFSAKELKRTP